MLTNKISTIFVLTTLFFICNFLVNADNFTAEFLELGIGGRAIGVGGAYVSVAGDISATYWNPAGIAGISSKTELAFQHATQRAELGNFNYFGVSNQAKPWLTIAVSWINASTGDIPIYGKFDKNVTYADRRNSEKYRPTFEPIGLMSSSENSYTLTVAASYRIAQDLWDNFGRNSDPAELMFGVNLKYISQLLHTSSAEAFAFDLGLLFRIPELNAFVGYEKFGSLSVGWSLSPEATIKWNSDLRELIPFNKKFGISYSNQFWGHNTILFYGRNYRHGREDQVGLEYELNEKIALRFGRRSEQFTGGVGFRLRWFKIDYAFWLNDLRDTHFISLTANL